MSAPDAVTEASRIAGNDVARDAAQRRVLTVVVFSQILGGAGLAAGITVGALLARDMLGTDSLSGLPAGLFTLGSALAAFLVGRVSQARGRRIGLATGFAIGGIGAGGVVGAAVLDNVVLLFVALFIYGAGTATNLQSRYAGTDLARPTQRGTAISIAMVSTTLGAVAGPNLVEPLGVLATSIGVPALAGPFLMAAVVYLAAGAVLFAFLRPDPLLIARHLPRPTPDSPAAKADASADGDETELKLVPRRDVGVAVGATVMVLTQIAMIAIMTMTPVHMRAHGHGLGEVGIVIGIHVGAMYLPSLITGRLVDTVGRVPMAIASGVTLLAAGVTAALAPADSVGLLVLALALLGVGWNFGLIAG
ncbi:MAG: MFS transporter, partial [Rhodococcus sp. (in: high G+C Gram-positive bacteria)]